MFIITLASVSKFPTSTLIRATAARILIAIIEKGISLADSLPTALTDFPDPRDKSLLQALCYGVSRWYVYLDAIAKRLLDKPLKAKESDIYALLLVGLYQLKEMRIPAYAAVTETVNATAVFKKPWARNLVNAVLRNYQRRVLEMNAEISNEVCYSHPQWLVDALQEHYPTEWQVILNANNAHPPFALRVNLARQSRETYLQKIPGTIIPWTKAGVVLESAMDVLELPGFIEGDVSVQDGAAQLAAELLAPAATERVLDACAAPGGKACHILEMQPNVQLVALDHDAERVALIHENLQRLHLQANCIVADAASVASWWDGEYFDSILLDAPCSATGVIRRHPDIKLLRQASDIRELAATQLHLLTRLWAVLKPGGKLLYVTCSILPAENTEVVQRFLAEHLDAKEEKIMAEWGMVCRVGRQILPGAAGMDGFYFACLRKNG